MRRTLFALFCLLGAGVLPAETLTLSIVGTPEDPAYVPFIAAVRQAFRDVGYELDFQSFPGERGLVEANDGRIDGDLARIPELLTASYPNLVRVPEPLVTVSNRVYAIKDLQVDSVDDLVRQGLSVATYSGLKWAEVTVKPRVSANRWNSTPEYEMALKMLVSGRVDVLIATDLAVQKYLALPAYASVKPVGTLVTVQDYLQLNRKWADLAPRVAERLRIAKAR